MTAHQDRRHESRLSTSGDYEREAEHTRRRLAENLDELSDRLTPGQVFDEMLTYSRAGSGTFFRAFSNAMRENPLPSLLIGAGCMMFLSEKMGLRPGLGNGGRPMMATADDPYGYAARSAAPGPGAASRMTDAAGRATGSVASSARSAASSVQSGVNAATETVSRQTSNAAGAVADAMRQTAATVVDTASGAADSVRGTASDLRGQASSAAEQVVRSAQTVAGAVRGTATSMTGALAETATSMGGTLAGTATSMTGALADTASTVGGALADTASRTSRQAMDAVRQGRETAASFVTDQPLLCAAIGVAVGAAIASLLPSTKTENRLMGEASDAVKDKAGQVGSDAVGSAKNVASKVADRAQSAVKEEGLSPGAVAEAARNLGEGIKEGAIKQATTGTEPQEGMSAARKS